MRMREWMTALFELGVAASLTALVALADYFDISLDYLLGREEY